MSVQFGKWHIDGRPVSVEDLEKVKPMIAPYGPDHCGTYRTHGIGVLYGAFHTTKESRSAQQPHVMDSGSVLVWDGRLDNRDELIRQLGDHVTLDSADVSIVAAAYQEWGTGSLARLIGDWALSIWDASSHSLLLAKDAIGSRHLYYSIGKNQITWSTLLGPIILFAERSITLNEEYIAGWFSLFPAAHLTPYTGIQAVPPSSFVVLRPTRSTITKYWEFDPYRHIRYRTDGEYEEHFRTLFSQAVHRRLRSDNPILAELSGGMDSSAIVCMADSIVALGCCQTPRVDTVSYYDDSEPNWNERPFFLEVEKKRGFTGTHIDVSSREMFGFVFNADRFAATPHSAAGNSSTFVGQFAACVSSHGNRVLLSGIGGDEVTGGVPTPVPELEDLLVCGRLGTLAHQLGVWALQKRKPWFHLFLEAVRSFLPPALVGVPRLLRPQPWLCVNFVRRNRRALQGYPARLSLFGPLPSFQENLSALSMLQRQLSCSALSSEPPLEKRYPYLDRELLEFLFAVPRDQLVRPGQRRSLMRRALVGIVPDALLNRKRKAFIARSPLTAISAEWPRVMEATRSMLSASLGIIDQQKLLDTLAQARQGGDVATIPLVRAVGIELWLRHLVGQRFFGNNSPEALKHIA